MIKALFAKSISGGETFKVREVLPACLPVVDGDISLMYDLSKDTFKNYKERVKKIALKSEDKLFNAAIECINLRVILMHLTQHYV